MLHANLLRCRQGGQRAGSIIKPTEGVVLVGVAKEQTRRAFVYFPGKACTALKQEYAGGRWATSRLYSVLVATLATKLATKLASTHFLKELQLQHLTAGCSVSYA